MTARIYAFANQKGGVGKTTTVVNMGAYLAEAGMRVLVVDLDPQANATSGFGYNKLKIKKSAYHLLVDKMDAADVIVRHEATNVDILPAHPSLAGAEIELVNLMAREYRLRSALEPIVDNYDYILIDCPPSLGLLTINSLTAARSGAMIPVQCEYLALEGLSMLTQTIQMVRKHLNKALRVRGLIMTMYDGRTNLSRQVIEEVREHFPGMAFRAIIPRNVRLSEAPSYGLPINLYAPRSTGALAYKVLTAELIQGDTTRKRA